jgi:serine/threonine protein kinase
MTELAAGQTIEGLADAYQLGAELGGGGFGVTWRASRSSDGKQVVLKLLRLDRMGDWKALELFEREASVLASLDHPHVPGTHDYFAWADGRAIEPSALPTTATEGPPRFVMVQDFVPGRTLAARVSEGERFDDSQLDRVLRDLLEILEYLHGLNPAVVHRDIKPANVIIDAEGRAHLVDFGATQAIARRESEVGSTSVGTFGFIPLEQMMGKARAVSDLYALGMTMLVAATHRQPEALPIDEATSKVDVDSAAPNLAPALRRTLDRMLEPLAGQRVGSASETRILLDGSTVAVPTRSSKAALASPVEHPTWLPTTFNAATGLGGTGAAILYVGFFDSFSETELVQLSVLWLAPLLFGVVGKVALESKARRPVGVAALGMGFGMLALVGFIYGIFPAL